MFGFVSLEESSRQQIPVKSNFAEFKLSLVPEITQLRVGNAFIRIANKLA